MAEEGGGSSRNSSGAGREQEGGQLCDAFLDRFAGLMDHRNVKSMLAEQEHMLGTLEVANEKLSNLNSLSEENYQRMSQEFRQNTRTLSEVKRELDSVFRRIRSLKTRLAAQYPEAYASAEAHLRVHTDDDDKG